MTTSGQSRRSGALGGSDPRGRRAAQGLVDDSVLARPPLGLDRDGYLTIVGKGAYPGDTLIWNGTEWKPGSPVPLPTTVKTQAYTAKPNEIVLCDPTAAGFTVSLPPKANLRRPLVIVNVSGSSNVITIAAYGQELVNGASTATIAAPYAALSFYPTPEGMVAV